MVLGLGLRGGRGFCDGGEESLKSIEEEEDSMAGLGLVTGGSGSMARV